MTDFNQTWKDQGKPVNLVEDFKALNGYDEGVGFFTKMIDAIGTCFLCLFLGLSGFVLLILLWSMGGK